MILGKFLAALVVFITFLVLTMTYPLVFAFLTRMDWGQMATGYLGVLLLGASCLALGLFASSLTANQISPRSLLLPSSCSSGSSAPLRRWAPPPAAF